MGARESKIRVLITLHILRAGGLEVVLHHLARYLTGDGMRVDFLETYAPGPWAERFVSSGFDVQTVARRMWRSKRHHTWRLAKILCEYDVVILNDTPRAQAVLGLLPDRSVALSIAHLTMDVIARNAVGNWHELDGVVAVSPGVMKRLTSLVPVDRDRVHCIDNGIPVSNTWPKQGHGFYGKRELRICYVGRMDARQKGIMHLPGILAQVIQSGCPSRLALIGGGPDLGALQRAFSRKGLVERVEFVGAVPHEASLRCMGESDILVLPSYAEGLPITLLEAMAAGVVPVVSDLPGCTRHVVRDGAEGFLVQPGQEEQYAAAVARLGSNRRLLRSCSEAAWRAVKNRFNVEKMGRAYVELIRNARENRTRCRLTRSGQVDTSLLGDLPNLPEIMVPLVRRGLRTLGLWKDHRRELRG